MGLLALSFMIIALSISEFPRYLRITLFTNIHLNRYTFVNIKNLNYIIIYISLEVHSLYLKNEWISVLRVTYENQ